MANEFDDALPDVPRLAMTDLEAENVPSAPADPTRLSVDDLDATGGADYPPMPTPIAPTEEADPDYMEAAQGLNEIDATDTRSMLYGVKDTNPDEYAQHRELATQLGRTPEEVAADPERAKLDAQFGDNEYYDLLKKENPEIASMIASDPDAAKLMQDDIEELKGITGWFKAIGLKATDSLDEAQGAEAAAMEYLVGGNEITDQVREQWANEGFDALTDYGYDGVFSSLAQASAEQFGPMYEAGKGAIAGGGAGAAGGAAVGSVVPGIGTIGGGLFGLGRGAMVGTAYKTAMMEGGFALKEFAIMKDENGEYIDPNVARGAAGVVALANGGLETLGLGVLVKNIPGGDKLVELATRGAIKKALRDRTFREAIQNFGIKYAEGITAETATEAGQELFTILGKIGAAQADGGQFDTGTLEENAARVSDAAVMAAKSTVLLNAPGPSLHLAKDVAKMKKAGIDQKRVMDLAAGVEAAKTTKRAPDKLGRLIGMAKQEGDYQHAYIGKEAFDTFYQSQGIAPEDAAADLDIQHEYNEAKATGGSIAVPVEIYASKMIPSQAYQALINDTKFDPDGFNVTEAQAYLAEYKSRVNAEVEKVQADLEAQGAERSVRAQIYDDAYNALGRVGYKDSAARQYATLIAARYSAQAEASGLDAMRLYQDSQIGTRLRRALPESLNNTDETRLRRLVDRLQNGEGLIGKVKGIITPQDPAQAASDAQAVQDIERYAQQLGIDAKTTDADTLIRAIKENGVSRETDGEQVLNQMATPAQDEITVGLSANTGSIPGLAELGKLAGAGDKNAHILLNTIGLNNLRRLLSGLDSVNIETDFNTGLYGGTVEPSLGLKVKFDPADRRGVLAALAKFAQNFNQEQVHVRQETNDPVGTDCGDGSYATPVFRYDLAAPLTREEVEQIIAESGLYGLTFNENFVEAYYVGDPLDGQQIEQFIQGAGRARSSLGTRSPSHTESVNRLWVYGEGAGAIPYESVAGDVRTAPVGADPTAIAVGEHYFNGRIYPTEQADQITPGQQFVQQQIADEYEALPVNDMRNPDVRRAYTELVDEVTNQFKALPIKVEIWDASKGEPYANSDAMRYDVQDNNHLYIYATTPESFGPPGVDFSGHPLLEPTGFTDVNGTPLLANDLFRAVHDYYAHNITATNFGPRGEEAAWKNHLTTIKSPWARWALTTETRGQNSWVNFGRHVRDQAIALKERPFADQKAALLSLDRVLTGNNEVDKPVLKLMKELGLVRYSGSMLPNAIADIRDSYINTPPDVNPLGFYSKMARVLAVKLNAAGTVKQYREQINAFAKSGQFKPEELEWSGILDYLDMLQPDQRISREEIISYFNDEGFSLEEVGESQEGTTFIEGISEDDFRDIDSGINDADPSHIDEMARDYHYDEIRQRMAEENAELDEDDRKTPEELDDDAMDEAREKAEEDYNNDDYNWYTLYRLRHEDIDADVEVRSSYDSLDIEINGEFMDNVRDWPQAISYIEQWLNEHGYSIGGDGPDFGDYTGDGGENYSFYRLRVPKGLKGGEFTQRGHYQEKDVVLHYRTKDRVGPNGEKMLFIEEIQSDIHQAAYSKKQKTGIGYVTEVDKDLYDMVQKEIAEAGAAERETSAAVRSFYERVADEIVAEMPETPVFANDLGERIKNLYDIYSRGIDDPKKWLVEKRDGIIQQEARNRSYRVNWGKILYDTPGASAINHAIVREALNVYQKAVETFDTKPEYKAFINKFFEDEIRLWSDTVKEYLDMKADGTFNENSDGAEYERAVKGVAQTKEAWDFMMAAPPPYMMSPVEQATYLIDKLTNTVEEWQGLTSAVFNASERYNAAVRESAQFSGLVPYAPFGKTWRQVGLKRMLIKAAQGGYKSIGWTTGTQQNVRYSLSKFIDSMDASKGEGSNYIVYVDNRGIDSKIMDAANQLGETVESSGDGGLVMSPNAMDAIFGKANAEQIRNQVDALEGNNTVTNINFDEGIEVGGDKKGNLYDGVLPIEFKDVMKKIDGSRASLIDYDMEENGRQIGKIWYGKIGDFAKAKIREGLELFQNGGESVQGSYNRNTKAITLFEKSDLSTLLHELGHLWLEETRELAMRSDVREEYRKDWETLKQWLGYEDETMPFTREQHEKFARSFELYLREGNAPSLELQGAFDTFASWLRRIYKTVNDLIRAAGFNVTINNDVRGVFDRMLATSEEIEQQRMQAAFLEDPAIMELLSPLEEVQYLNQKKKARDKAKADLMAKAMRAVREKRTAEYRYESDAVRAEVIERFKMDPEYQAMEVLMKGHFIDDPKNEKGVPRIKISRNWFLENFGIKPYIEVIPSKTGKTWMVLKEGVNQGKFKTADKANEAANVISAKAKKIMPKDLPPHVRRMIAQDGAHPDTVANTLSPGTFQSGRAMVERFMKAQPLREAVDNQVKAEMDQRFPELLDEASMSEEALKSMYNDLQAATMEMEYRAIAKRTNYKPFTKEMARSIAERVLSTKKVRDLRGTYQYHRTALQLAQKLGKALGAKDFELAADLKRKQMINHYLFMLTRQNEDKIDQLLRYLKKFQKTTVREKIETEYIDQIDGILEKYDLRSQSSERTRRNREGLVAFLKRMEEAGTPVDIPDEVIADAYKISYKDMPLADFIGMAETVEHIEHLGRLKNKLLKAAEDREFNQVVAEMTAAMEAANPEDVKDMPLAPRIRDRMKDGLDKWHAWHWKPEFIFRFLDGYEDNGPTWTALFKPIADAEAEESTLQAAYIGKMQDIFKDYDPGTKNLGLFEKRIWIPEMQMHLTKEKLMAIALNWGNEYNRDALIEGEKSRGWTHEIVQEVLDKYLTEKDWSTVQSIWDLIDSLWPRIEAMEKRLNGKAPEKVQATPVSTPYGVLRGGYYPINFDANRNEKVFARQEKEDSSAVFPNNYTRPATKKGHTKERKGTGGQPLNLSLSVVSDHLYNVIHDLSFREAGIDVLKLLEEPRVKDKIVAKAGRHAYRQLRPWLQRVINEKRQIENPAIRALGHLRANSTIVAMGLKLTTALQQPLGYLTTIDAIGHKYAGHGLKTFYGMDADANPLENMKEQMEKVNKLSPFMAERSKTFDREIRQALELLARDNKLKNWQSSMFYMTQLVQKGVDYPTWLGAYSKGMNELFDGDESRAVDYADSVVRRTQSAGGQKDLAAIQSGGEVARFFTMFYSYFSVLYNVAAERSGQFKRGKIGVGKAVASAFYLWFLPVYLGALITGQEPDDDESYAAWLARIQLSFPFQTIVGVRDVVNSLASGYDYRITPVEAALEGIVEGFRAAGEGLTGDELSESEQKSLVYGVGYAVGLPAGQVWNSLDYLRDYVNGEKEGFSLYEFLVKQKKE